MVCVNIGIDVPNLAEGVRFYSEAIHVEDLAEARARAVRAGAIEEQVFLNPEHGSAAFCCDPFGYGFCLIERKA